MSPATATASRRPAAAPRPAPRRPPLRAVEGGEHRRLGRRRSAQVLSLVLVGGSLLTVVLGHAMEAQTQVRLSGVQAALSAEQTAHREDVLALAQLETPSRIAAEAQQQLHLVTPSRVDQLPSVPLTTPLAAPKVGAAPAAATTATTSPTTTPTTATPSSARPVRDSATAPAGARPPGSSGPTRATTGAGQVASVPGQ